MPTFVYEEHGARRYFSIEKTFDGFDSPQPAVEIHFGIVGTEGSRRLYPFDTEREADHEYRRQIETCERSGYELVPKESVATKPAPAPERTGERYVFRDRKRARFAWVELDGNRLSIATGPMSELHDAKPRVEACVSERVASKKRDALVAEWMSQGFELAEL